MYPTKNYADRPKTKSAIALTKIILKICTFSIKNHDFTRITHFSETTKDRNLIFGMGGDANVKLCIQQFLSPGPSPTLLGNLYKKCDRDPHPYTIYIYDPIRHLICLITLIINIYGLGVGISTIKKFTSGRGGV
jgi:hypothetical protein